MSGLATTFRSLGAAHLLILGGVEVGIILFFVFLTSKLTTPDMVLLFGDLDMQDSGAIVSKLDTLNVPYELSGNGTRIMVPGDQVLRLRMAMAEDGLPSGGSIGYEIFDRSESLGTTNFVQNINLVRALEGELARTIRSISGVQASRVHLVLPRRQLFSREEQEPSASVVLQTRGNSRINAGQVLAIQQLVAAAVPGLAPGKVTVVDDKGALLARAAGENTATALMTQSDDMRRSYEDRLGRTIESLIERSVGPGNVRAQVTALLDFDRVTTRSKTFDPDGQVVRSTQTVEEIEKSAEQEPSDTVTVENNLPDEEAEAGAAATSRSDSNRVEETVNYEISETVTDHYHETGAVRRLSVAVLVDGEYTGNGEERSYEPRSDEELAQMSRLVKSAIGFDESRGDTVEIVNMPFKQLSTDWGEEQIEPIFGLAKQDYFRIAEILVLSIVALLVIMLVVRPLVARTLEALPKPQDVQKAAERLISDSSGGPRPALPPGMEAPAPGMDGGEASLPLADAPESLINLEQVEGRVRASSIKKVGEIVKKHPEESVSILRNWMYQEG